MYPGEQKGTYDVDVDAFKTIAYHRKMLYNSYSVSRNLIFLTSREIRCPDRNVDAAARPNVAFTERHCVSRTTMSLI